MVYSFERGTMLPAKELFGVENQKLKHGIKVLKV